MPTPERRHFRALPDQKCPMCGALTAGGATVCRTCGADLTRAGFVVSTVVTPISRRKRGKRLTIVLLPIIALVVVLGLGSVDAVSARIPMLATMNSTAEQAFRRVVAWGKTINPLRPASTPEVGVPPATVPTGNSTGAPPPAARVEASVTILSNPAGAKVYVDATSVGTTPVTLTSIAPGTHRVKIQSLGYLPLSQTFKLGSGERVTLHLTLKAVAGQTRKPTGQPAPSLRQPGLRKPLEIGTRAPQFVLKDRFGVLYNLRDFQGYRVAILIVWNLDPHARRTIKDLDVQARKPHGQYIPLVILMVPDRVAIRNFVASEGISVPILFGDDRIAEVYGISGGLPGLYLISERGIIVRRQTGTIHLPSVLR